MKTKFPNKIVLNSLRTPDGTVLTSTHRHDYVTHTDKNGKEYMTDGGKDYIRRSMCGDEEDLTILMSDGHEIVRENFYWGSYGRDVGGELTRLKLPIITDEHIQNILDNMTHIKGTYVEEVFLTEVEYRDTKGIKVLESINGSIIKWVH